MKLNLVLILFPCLHVYGIEDGKDGNCLKINQNLPMSERIIEWDVVDFSMPFSFHMYPGKSTYVIEPTFD